MKHIKTSLILYLVLGIFVAHSQNVPPGTQSAWSYDISGNTTTGVGTYMGNRTYNVNGMVGWKNLVQSAPTTPTDSNGLFLSKDTSYLWSNNIWRILGPSVSIGCLAGTGTRVVTTNATGGLGFNKLENMAWGLTGNDGTDPTINFIGTTDAVDFVFKADNTDFGRVTSMGSWQFGQDNDVSGISTSMAIGNGDTVLGRASVATGTGLYLNDIYTYATGEYNERNVPNLLWALGNGTTFDDASRKNAITVLKNGNVGIGTSTPNYKLDIQGDLGVYASLAGDETSVVVVPGRSETQITTSLGGLSLFQQTEGLQFTGSGDVILQYSVGNGNVGIGMSSPLAKLDVTGTFRQQFDNGTTTAVITNDGNNIRLTTSNNTSGERTILNVYSDGIGLDYDQDNTGTLTQSILANSSGLLLNSGSNDKNVGIGTTTPITKLDVAGIVGNEGLRFKSTNYGTDSVELEPQVYGCGCDWDTYKSLAFTDYNNDEVVLSVPYLSNGGGAYLGLSDNVGIGTTTPASKLTVTDGDVYITDIGSGVITKDDDGFCWRCRASTVGAFECVSITCP